MPNVCRSIEDYQILLESSPMMVWMADDDRNFNYFNRKWKEFRGLESEKETGRAWLSAIHPDDREAFIALFVDSFDRKECFETEFRLLSSSGEHRWVYCSGAPVVRSDGGFTGFIGTCMDIHGHIRRERVFDSLLNEIKSEGVVPICSACRKIRDIHGVWHDLEEYLSQKGGIDFSHTVCPECEEHLYPK